MTDRLKPLITGMALILTIILVGRAAYNAILSDDSDSSASDSHQKIFGMLAEGRYEKVITLLNDAIDRHPEDKQYQILQALLMDELRIDFKFRYLNEGTTSAAGQENRKGLILSKDNPYYLQVNSSDECYLYIYQISNSGRLTQLLPNQNFTLARNPISDTTIRIPSGEDWLFLDNEPGEESIYLLASRWRQNELEELTAQLMRSGDGKDAEALVKKIKKRLESEQQNDEIVPGMICAEFEFEHEKTR